MGNVNDRARNEGLAIEWSHGAARPIVRADEIPALPTAPTGAVRDPITKRFAPGNQAAAGRSLRRAAREQALLGLDPASVDPWMAPFVVHAQRYAGELVASLPRQAPALNALAGDAATAAAVYRGLLALGTSNGPDAPAALREARAWLREHRQSLATLSALAGREPAGDSNPDPLAAFMTDGDES